mmetsp:Transcript_13074/g.19716  ORF Transcript_13074/g.19716 Transcript_13074/m.19716 type:complete len:126 (+) Transcript_13074:92-469(+)|eukprot:CAMPEP_0185025292 /NCGR_PEP_ID=MMETSP1103-20130426/8306_1 /TAXON_ID=36769 /ORGANISM="Paraphysomonas bandaiensis, Strain Caron Lab Isolate" /LENGTH=125 /DNA_ID=CAMNT_0027558459 /DNA_START=86 /DNA_END=463 /DNA_ORIENTATION=+
MSAAAPPPTDQTIVKLTYRQKVPISSMKEIIQECLQDKLTGKQYEGEKCAEAARLLSDTIRDRLKALNYERYKFAVQVIIGERRDQGVRMGTRCFWDSNTDNQASATFFNDHIFAVATAYAVYFY